MSTLVETDHLKRAIRNIRQRARGDPENPLQRDSFTIPDDIKNMEIKNEDGEVETVPFLAYDSADDNGGSDPNRFLIFCTPQGTQDLIDNPDWACDAQVWSLTQIFRSFYGKILLSSG